MPGPGYRLLRQVPLTQEQRVAGVLVDVNERTNMLDRARPGFSVGTTDPGAETPVPGFSHLNSTTGRLWFYTDRGWVTADSQHFYSEDATEQSSISGTYNTLSAMSLTIPPGGAWAMIFARSEITGDTVGATPDLALNDGSVIVNARFLTGAVATPGLWLVGQTMPDSSTGSYPPSGGFWSVYYPTGGTYSLGIMLRSAAGTVRSRNRYQYAVVL